MIIKKYKIGLILFTRDLRLEDHTALNNAQQECDFIIPLFIFTNEQILKNTYKSDRAIQYMIESLQELEITIKENGGTLYCFLGDLKEIIEDLIKKNSVEAIYINTDYTPYSKERALKIKAISDKNNVSFNTYHDYLLINPDELLKKNNKPYIKFTPFYKEALKKNINEPLILKKFNFLKKINHSKKLDLINLSSEMTPKGLFLKKKLNSNLLEGGTDKAKKILANINKLSDYDKTRNIPSQKTSFLSTIHKFGTLSIRQTAEKIIQEYGKKSTLLKELYWRDFFTYIAYHFPHVFKGSFYEKFNSLKWENNNDFFKLWCNGKTGFPIVDAGMRQLNETGYMHNRIRMIVASFLTKDLRINWQWGEKYFAQHLIDYDPSVNNGNWQWAASTGCDSQPYYRIFNPWIQQKEYDPECIYIKTWIPELKKYSSTEIHNLEKKPLTGYPYPCINHSTERVKTLAWFKKI
jgi:deoxyribodipyrimidine photo-lyase